jgi:hypothetical protein
MQEYVGQAREISAELNMMYLYRELEDLFIRILQHRKEARMDVWIAQHKRALENS